MRFSLLLLPFASATVHFKESFNTDSWKDSWTESTKWKNKDEMGTWSRVEGQWHGGDTSLMTSDNARFYGLSSPLSSPFDNTGKDLVVQYTVKHEQRLDCGGAYIKLLRGGDAFDGDKFGGDSEYGIMFGPDICGSGTRRTHVIFNRGGENHLIEKDVRCETDQLSHLYTLHLKADDTFEVLIDNKSVRSGSIEDEFKILEPREIDDPDQSKPNDWVDERRVPDPDDVKPDGYDDVPPEIPDPEATRPDDWDDEDDGEWEAPTIKNPDYKGTWKPKMIDNPDYKGPWVHPKIPNPSYAPAANLHAFCGPAGGGPCTHIGFELWQVTAGTSFDDIIVTDSIAEAQAFAEETFFKKIDKEKAMYEDAQEREREAAQRKAEEEDLKAKIEQDEEDGHDEF